MKFDIGDLVINDYNVKERLDRGEFAIVVSYEVEPRGYTLHWPRQGSRTYTHTHSGYLESELILISKEPLAPLSSLHSEKIEVSQNNRIYAIKHLREHCDKTFGIYPGLKDTKDFVDKLLETKDRAEAIESLKAMLKSGKDSNKFTKGQVVDILDEIFT